MERDHALDRPKRDEDGLDDSLIEEANRPEKASSDLGWQGLRSPGLARCLESSDVGFVLEGQADVIQPFHEAPARVIADLERHDDIATDHLTVHQEVLN